MTNSLEETKNVLLEKLNNEKLKNLYTGNRLDILKTSLNKLIDDLELIDNEEEVNVEPSTINEVLRILHFLEKYTIERELDEFLIETINSINLLIYNWNSNTTNNKDIELASKTLRMLVEQHYTLTSAIQTMKILLEKLNKYSNIAPLSVNLSKHYLNILHERNNND